MSKRPPKQGSNAGWTPTRPTVGLPPPALGAARPTVGLPASAMGHGAVPSANPRAASSRPTIIAALQKGGALYAAGRFKEAGDAARFVLSLAPNQPDALHLLGLVSQAQGQPAEAEKLIALAIRVARPNPNLLVNLGKARAALGKTAAALSSYRSALNLDPLYADALEARSELLFGEGRFDEALADIDELIRIRPAEIRPYLKASSMMNDLGRFREALRLCDRAIAAFNPPPVELLVMIAVTHERLSELDAAVHWAESALKLSPHNGNALRVWAKAQRRIAKRNPELLRKVEERLKSVDVEKMSVAEARVVYSELANVCDELGEVDAAFDYFRMQNEKTLEFVEQAGPATEDFLKEVERLIEAFGSGNGLDYKPLPAPSPGKMRSAPVFLVGFPRSGTTLLDQILDAHPDTQVAEELPLLKSMKTAVDAFPAAYPQSLTHLSEKQRSDLRRLYADEVTQRGFDIANKIFVDKMPLNLVHVGLINRVFPDAKIILALRHPADVVLSCFMQDFVPNGAMVNFLTLEGSARLYDRVMTLWRRYRELLPLNVVEVRYENLIRDLRSEVEPVLDFLGLPWNEAQADPAAHALARGTIRTPSYAQVTQPIYSSAADRWRRYEKHLAPVLPLLKKHIEYFGYTL